MKRKIDEIPVSKHLDKAVEIGLNRAKFIHRKRLAKKSLAAAASLAVAFTAFLVWGFSNPVLASQLPWIGHIFAQNEAKISFPGNYSDKADVLAEDTEDTSMYTVSDAGYTFTANEVFCDGASVYLALTVKKDIGFGQVEAYPSSRNANSQVQAISILCAVIDIHTETPIQLIATNTAIEGTQISDDTFEGILKIDLENYTLPDNDYTLDVEIQSIYCTDASKTDQSKTNSNPNGNWKLSSIPFTVQNQDTKIIDIHDVNEKGFGIGTVIITPSEVRVQSILPPIYASKEELLSAKREFAGEDGIGMTDEEIDDYVGLSLFDNYGVSLFDTNGNALEFQEEILSLDNSGYIHTFSINNADTSRLYFYIDKGDHETVKETNQQAMDAKALYSYVICAE